MALLLPDLSKLSVSPAVHRAPVRELWLEACGTRPNLKQWSSMRAEDKRRLLHSVAAEADEDGDGANYLTAYDQVDTDDLHGEKSVEHVLARSAAGANPLAKTDFNNWVQARQSANSRRGSKPLLLWQPDNGQIALANSVVKDPLTGERHYAPPLHQRARLARKWIFTRATYQNLQPPSRWQAENAHKIFALAKHYPAHEAELRVNAIYRRRFDWANPLLEHHAEQWYDSAAFRQLVFPA